MTKTSQTPATAVVLAHRLRPVLLRLNRQLRHELTALGVTPGQVSALAAIEKRPGLGVGALAEIEGVSPPAISIMVSRLEAAGFVSRAPAEDRRRIGLTITSAGGDVLESVKSRRTAWLATRLEELNLDDLAAVEAALDPLEQLLDGR